MTLPLSKYTLPFSYLAQTITTQPPMGTQDNVSNFYHINMQGGKAKGDMASSIECYMVEHRVTSEVAISKILSLLEDEWKTLNEARFEDHSHLPVVQRIINFANSMLVFYAEKDAYTFSINLKETIE